MCMGLVVSILLLISHLLTDQQVAQLIASIHGYNLYTAFTGLEGLRLFYGQKPDLLILHDALTDLSCEQVCQRIRNFADTPILLLREVGAYGSDALLATDTAITTLARPIQPATLLAHIQQTLQQQQQLAPQPALLTATPSAPADLIVDHLQYQVILDKVVHQLSAVEYQLLIYLIANAGRILSHQQLLTALGNASDHDHLPDLQTLVWRLRRKIEHDPRRPRRLVSHYGVGYAFDYTGITEQHRTERHRTERHSTDKDVLI